jgi:ribose transport system ATP-binding protein
VTAPGALMRIENLAKRFGATVALDDVSLEIEAGEVHGLVGQNGSGKSTLIKILSGYHAPDGGSVAVHGERVRPPIPPRELRQLGIEFVHQDLGLVGTMSVLENLRVGRYATGRLGRIRWRAERATALRLLRRFELDADPDTPVERLSQTERAIVAIARAVHDVEEHRGSGLLVLDEPTAALPASEVGRLFDAVRTIARDGSAVLIVTHNLEEVFEITDRVSVLRDGRVVAVRPTAELDERRLIELIVGRDLGDAYPVVASSARSKAMEVRDLRGAGVHGVSFVVRRGEILGLTGLAGAGHDDVPYLVCGARRAEAGTIAVGDARLDDPSPERARRAGVALLPADRQRQSAILRATVRENVTLPGLAAFRRRPLGLDHGRERTAVQQVLANFDVRPRDPEQRMLTLSGGNQQKALLGRCLRMDPRVLLLHEPTQGVDVGARRGIFEILSGAAAAGTAIVYASTEYEDLAHVCDRVLVFRRGRAIAELQGDALTSEAILAHCYQSAAA